MSDIVVRVPSTEIDHFWEENHATYEWWTLARAPKRHEKGDLIFFAIGGDVVAFALTSEIKTGPAPLHSDDGRVWKGAHVVWSANSFTKLGQPIPLTRVGVQVPRGFAYVERAKLRNRIFGGPVEDAAPCDCMDCSIAGEPTH